MSASGLSPTYRHASGGTDAGRCLVQQGRRRLADDHIRLAPDRALERGDKHAAARHQAAAAADVRSVGVDGDEARAGEQRSHRDRQAVIRDAAVIADQDVVRVLGIGHAQAVGKDFGAQPGIAKDVYARPRCSRAISWVAATSAENTSCSVSGSPKRLNRSPRACLRSE